MSDDTVDDLCDVFAAKILKMGFTEDTIGPMTNVAGELIYQRFVNRLPFTVSFWNSVHDRLIKEYPFLDRSQTEQILEFVLIIVTNLITRPEVQKEFLIVANRYRMTLSNRGATMTTTEDNT